MSRRRKRTPPASLEALAGAEGVDITELLRDVSDFRLALDVDLTVAAAAADAVGDAAAPAVLPSELTGLALDSGLDGVARIRRRSAARADSPGTDSPGTDSPRTDSPRANSPRPPARRRLLTLVPTAPLVLVAVALGLGGGAIASHLTDSPATPANAAADSSLATLSSAIGQGNRAATVAAGHRLQADVAALIRAAPGNPEAARDAATLLLAEQTVIAQLPGTEGDELRAMMATQSAQLQRVSGSPISTLGNLTTVGTPGSRASLIPSPPSAISLPTGAPHSLLPSAVRSQIPLPPRPSLQAPLTDSTAPAASPTAAATPPATQSATPSANPSATPSPATTATAATPAPSPPAPSLGLPTSSSFNGLTSPPLLGG